MLDNYLGIPILIYLGYLWLYVANQLYVDVSIHLSTRAW